MDKTHVDKVIDDISKELEKASEKHPGWPDDPFHALAILGEEYGELAQAVLQLTYEPHKSSRERVHDEAVQVGAMALRLIISLDEYEYEPSSYHYMQDGRALGRIFDWSEAERYFNDVMKRYKDLEGRPGVNTTFALMATFAPLKARYESGERTPELYEAMMSVE